MEEQLSLDMWRATRLPIARGCGPQTLHLSRRAGARRKLRGLLLAGPLCVRELAEVMGVEYSTLRCHLAGKRIASARVDWYHRVESLRVEGDRVHLVVRLHLTRARRRG